MTPDRTAAQQRLLDRVRQRIACATANNDRDIVLSLDALRDVDAVMSTVGHDTTDVEVCRAAGMLLWLRFINLPEGHGEQDFDRAVTLLQVGHGLGFDINADDPATLDTTIDLLTHAEAMVSDDHPRLDAILTVLSQAVQSRLDRDGDPVDLDRAIEIGRRLAKISRDPSQRGARLHDVALDLFARYESHGSHADLAEVIVISGMAADLPADDGDLPERLNLLAIALSAHAPLSSSTVDELDKAIEVSRSAVSKAAPTDEDRPVYLSNLAGALQAKAQWASSAATMNEALSVAREAAAEHYAGHPDHASHLANLCGVLVTQFQFAGTSDLLDEAVEMGELALALTPQEDTGLPTRLNGLAVALSTRADYTDSSDDLRRASELLRQAIEFGQTDPDQAMYLANLSEVMLALYGRTQHSEAMREAVDAACRAVNATAADDPELPGRLSNLAAATLRRFEIAGSPLDLDEAVELCQRSVAAVPEEHIDHAMYLSNLGMALTTRYEHGGAVADLDEAVSVSRAAVSATSPSSADWSSRMANLGAVLSTRYERLGALGDLQETIAVTREATSRSLPADPDLPGRLSNLSTALFVLFIRTRDASALDSAVAEGRHAIAGLPEGHIDTAAILSNLSIVLRTRFESEHRVPPAFPTAGEIADVDEAVRVAESAVDMTGTDNPDRARYQTILSTALSVRSGLRGGHTGDADEADRAVEIGRQAVEATAPGNPERAGRLHNLAAALLTRYQQSAQAIDRSEAAATFCLGAQSATAPTSVRAIAARRWAILSAEAGDWIQAVSAYTLSVQLLARIAPRGLRRMDQEFMLARLNGVGADAAGSCLNIDRSHAALQLWELGRAVLLGQALDARSAVSALERQHSELAMRFNRVRDELSRVS